MMLSSFTTKIKHVIWIPSKHGFCWSCLPTYMMGFLCFSWLIVLVKCPMSCLTFKNQMGWSHWLEASQFLCTAVFWSSETATFRWPWVWTAHDLCMWLSMTGPDIPHEPLASSASVDQLTHLYPRYTAQSHWELRKLS